MMVASEDPPTNEVEVAKRIKAMRDDELVNFIRDTVTRLQALADRLEVFADEEDGSARQDYPRSG